MLLTSLENLHPPLHFLVALALALALALAVLGADAEISPPLSLPDPLENVGELLMPS